ncbi:PHD finger protein ALFIN-LIKE 4-like [Trifolium pratense]|uniref:PHD finger protein ALFIN-LIKE 4-like n=1 Tax=Trifolium pratense TaxID=57577 RepID=UPI001E696630|nr:PHD finger protein ALFIN-LIKE 4-like [Trifolium pratense]
MSGMQKTDWMSLVAAHSDSWLFGVAFYYGAQFVFNKSDREHLFNSIDELPTILEVVDAADVVNGAAKKQVDEKSSVFRWSNLHVIEYQIIVVVTSWLLSFDDDSFGYDMSWWKEEQFNASDVDANGLLNLAEFNE